MNIFKKVLNWIKGIKQNNIVSLEDDLSKILFDDNFISDGRKPFYRDLEIDIYSVDDNLKGEKNKRYIKTLRYNGIKLIENKNNVYITSQGIKNSFKSLSKDQIDDYYNNLSQFSNLRK